MREASIAERCPTICCFHLSTAGMWCRVCGGALRNAGCRCRMAHGASDRLPGAAAEPGFSPAPLFTPEASYTPFASPQPAAGWGNPDPNPSVGGTLYAQLADCSLNPRLHAGRGSAVSGRGHEASPLVPADVQPPRLQSASPTCSSGSGSAVRPGTRLGLGLVGMVGIGLRLADPDPDPDPDPDRDPDPDPDPDPNQVRLARKARRPRLGQARRRRAMPSPSFGGAAHAKRAGPVDSVGPGRTRRLLPARRRLGRGQSWCRAVPCYPEVAFVIYRNESVRAVRKKGYATKIT